MEPLLFFLSKIYNENFCHAGLRSILIDELGNMWPCQAYINRKEYHMGNIADILSNEEDCKEFNKVKNKLSEIKKSYIKKCNQCISRYWCDICIAYTSLTDDNRKNYYNEERCNYNAYLTEKILESISNLVKNNMLNDISGSIQALIDNQEYIV